MDSDHIANDRWRNRLFHVDFEFVCLIFVVVIAVVLLVWLVVSWAVIEWKSLMEWTNSGKRQKNDDKGKPTKIVD